MFNTDIDYAAFFPKDAKSVVKVILNALVGISKTLYGKQPAGAVNTLSIVLI